jgi:Fe-Mn family superoxide dismutase
MSEQAFEYHHGKHHKAYVDNLNKLIDGTEFEDSSLEEIIRRASGAIFNNAAQVWNHSFFWKCITPESDEDLISDTLHKVIKDSHMKDLEGVKKEFTRQATKLFGSGWTWLVLSDDKLLVKTTLNADTPIRYGDVPLLVCDVWEHAYYIDHKNDRATFVDEFFNYVDWKFVSDNARKE